MKTQNTKIPKANEIQILWRYAFSVPAVWFLFWVLNDLFVLHKAMSSVNMTNLLGLLICVALILVSANFDIISRRLNPKVQSIPQKPSQTSIIKPIEQQSETKPKASNRGKINQRTQPNILIQTMNQPAVQLQINKNVQVETLEQIPKESQPQAQQQNPAQKGCPHFLGYLNQKDSTKEIPVGCLACKNLIDCMSKRGQTK
jgi:hypothetical protein